MSRFRKAEEFRVGRDGRLAQCAKGPEQALTFAVYPSQEREPGPACPEDRPVDNEPSGDRAAARDAALADQKVPMRLDYGAALMARFHHCLAFRQRVPEREVRDRPPGEPEGRLRDGETVPDPPAVGTGEHRG